MSFGLLSLNDCAGVRETSAAFDFEEVTLNYTTAIDGATKAREVIISGG